MIRKSEQISTRIKRAKKIVNNKSTEEINSNSSSVGNALKVSSELVAAVLVSCVIGYFLDNWLNTKPWFILIFFFIGIVTGILNVIKTAKKMQKNNDLKGKK